MFDEIVFPSELSRAEVALKGLLLADMLGKVVLTVGLAADFAFNRGAF